MLPRALRLTRPDDFRRVMRAGKKHSGELMVMYTIPSSDVSRWGFVVSKNVGHAPRRNRVKHQLRAIATELTRGSTTQREVVLRALPAAATASGDALRAELTRLVEAA